MTNRCSYLYSGLERVKVVGLKLEKSERSVGWGNLLYFSSPGNDRQLHRVKLSVNDDVLIEIEKEDKDEPLLNYSIRDIYSNTRADVKIQGVIFSLSTKYIVVTVRPNLKFDTDSKTFTIRKVADSVTFDRLRKALLDLQEPSQTYHGCNLDHIFFKEAPIPEPGRLGNITFYNKNLDASQREAVRFALAQEKLCLIYGPPGTGKTTTIIEILMQLNKKDKRVLVCSPSNNAVDNMMEKLKAEEVKGILRLGNPARANPGLQELTLDVIMRKTFPHATLGFNRKVNHHTLQEAERNSVNNGRLVINPFSSRTSQVLIATLMAHRIIFSTLTSASPYEKLGYLINGAHERFDVVIIDESSQALQAACWIALPLAKCAILVGDPNQLAPTVVDRSAASELEKSLMHVFAEIPEFGRISTDLRHQYRMHEDIMKWPSKTFYSDILIADESVKHRKLDEICNLKNWPTLLLIDTRDCNFTELRQDDDLSCANEHEVEIVYELVKFYIKHGLKQEDIGVITPYKLQVKFIMSRLEKFPNVRVKTVDGFQGREKEVIIISFVRSNPSDQIGFLCDKNRINVAVTRAKKHLAIVADSWTVSSDSTVESLMEYMKSRAQVLSGKTYLKDLERMQYGNDGAHNTGHNDGGNFQQLCLGSNREKFFNQLFESDESWDSPPSSPSKKTFNITAHRHCQPGQRHVEPSSSRTDSFSGSPGICKEAEDSLQEAEEEEEEWWGESPTPKTDIEMKSNSIQKQPSLNISPNCDSINSHKATPSKKSDSPMDLDDYESLDAPTIPFRAFPSRSARDSFEN